MAYSFNCMQCGRPFVTPAKDQFFCSKACAGKGRRKIKPDTQKRSTRSAWSGMMRRCYKANRKDYRFYGAKGITVCDRWHNFENFLDDMGFRPNGLTLERKDPNGNYEPNNCIWDTWEHQHKNTRSVRPIEFNGRSMLVSEWALEFGLNTTTLKGRLARGLPMQEAASTPVKTPLAPYSDYCRNYTFQGETLSVSEWAKRFSLKCCTLKWRLRQGWGIEKSLTNPLHCIVQKP